MITLMLKDCSKFWWMMSRGAVVGDKPGLGVARHSGGLSVIFSRQFVSKHYFGRSSVVSSVRMMAREIRFDCIQS